MDTRAVVVVEDPGSEPGTSAGDGIAALQPVANQPIAHHVLDALEAAGIEEIVVVCSAESRDEVQCSLAGREARCSARLRFVEQAAPLDLAAGLRLAVPIIGDAPCVAHVANGLLEEPLGPLLDELEPDSPDVVLIVHQGPAADGHLSASTQATLHIAELDPERASLGMAGVSLFGAGALTAVARAENGTGGDLDWTAVAERLGAGGGELHVRLANAWHRYLGSPADLLELNRIALDRLENHQRRGYGRDNRIEGRVLIHEHASIQSSVIVGPAVIGAEAHIADAYIGPYTSIGAHARVEGAEIEGSIIAAGATVMHIGSRLAGSVIGPDARVFRDFSMPRAIRLRLAAGAEVALC
jgi:glucose-1-phosphate thymidylyltransferase